MIAWLSAHPGIVALIVLGGLAVIVGGLLAAAAGANDRRLERELDEAIADAHAARHPRTPHDVDDARARAQADVRR